MKSKIEVKTEVVLTMDGESANGLFKLLGSLKLSKFDLIEKGLTEHQVNSMFELYNILDDNLPR